MDTQVGFRFGVFEVCAGEGELRKNGRRIALQDKPFQLLLLLLQQKGSVVSRQEIRRSLWPEDTFVEVDDSINSAVKRLRLVLGDSASSPRFVATVPRRGYRFVADIERVFGTEVSAEKSEVGAEKVPEQTATFERQSEGEPRLLRRPAILGFISLAAILFFVWFGMEEPTNLPVEKPMLAVFPLQDTDPQADYLAVGLTEDLSEHLGRLAPDRLGVFASATVQQLGRNPAVPTKARQLGADFYMTGRLRREEDMTRIHVNLVKTVDGSLIWSDVYRYPPGLVPVAFTTDVARSVAATLLGRDEELMVRAATTHTEAYHNYLKGNHHMANQFTEVGMRQAVACYRRALELDPLLGEAYARLAEVYGNMITLGYVPGDETLELIHRLAAQGLEARPNLPDLHTAMGQAQLQAGRPREAEGHFLRALSAGPDHMGAVSAYLVFLASMGRNDEITPYMASLKAVDPLSPGSDYIRGLLLLADHRPGRAIEHLQRAASKMPNIGHGWDHLATAHIFAGNHQEAVAALERAVLVSDGAPRYLYMLGRLFAARGQQIQAAAVLDKLQARAKSAYVSRSYLQSLTAKAFPVNHPDIPRNLVVKGFTAYAGADVNVQFQVDESFRHLGSWHYEDSSRQLYTLSMAAYMRGEKLIRVAVMQAEEAIALGRPGDERLEIDGVPFNVLEHYQSWNGPLAVHRGWGLVARAGFDPRPGVLTMTAYRFRSDKKTAVIVSLSERSPRHEGPWPAALRNRFREDFEKVIGCELGKEAGAEG